MSAAKKTRQAAPPSAVPVQPIPINNGTIVLQGYRIFLDVDGGLLRCRDGLFEPRESRFDKADGIRRVIILGHSGSISFKASRWLYDTRASISQIDHDGEVIIVSVPSGSDDARLRRAQALAPFGEVGVETTRWLLKTKLAGQARVARSFDTDEARDIADRIDLATETLDAALSLEDLRGIEAHAAAIYWLLWETLPVMFARRDEKRIPPRWLSFGSRRSPLSGRESRAATPGNAILNYLYGILESETTLALRIAGLDPGFGILHTDQPRRDSLSLDAMEAVRGDVDAWCRDFLASHTFSRLDFGTLPDGTVRCTIDVTHELQTTAPLWRAKISPIVEKIARLLLDGYKPELRLATNLTHSNRIAARRRLKEHTSAGDTLETVNPSTLPSSIKAPVARRTARTCPECGAPVTNRKRTYCSDACAAARRRDLNQPRAAAAAQKPESLAKRSATITAKRKMSKAWEEAHPEVDLAAERSRFAREIAPLLTDVPTEAITRALDCTSTFARQLRAGKGCHPMYHDKLRQLVEESSSNGKE